MGERRSLELERAAGRRLDPEDVRDAGPAQVEVEQDDLFLALGEGRGEACGDGRLPVSRSPCS